MKSSNTQFIPTLISNNVDNFDEVARWVLDRNGVRYHDQRHGPGLYIKPVNKATGLTGNFNQPALVLADRVLSRSTNILDYFEEHGAPENRLYPQAPEAKQEAQQLGDHFVEKLMPQATVFAYSRLLPERKLTLPVFKEGIPLKEKVLFSVAYRSIAAKLSQALAIGPDSREASLVAVKKIFAEVEQRLSDGRRYLMGDALTAPDIIFAATAAPMVLPKQFGGAAPTIDKIPDEMRGVVEEMRATIAGKFIARLYEEDRPPIIK